MAKNDRRKQLTTQHQLLLTHRVGEARQFWLTMGSFFALLAMHVAYWFLTHPVNHFWLADFQLKGFGRRFFAFGTTKKTDSNSPDWTHLRVRWEWLHVICTILGLTSLILIAVAVKHQ